MSGKVEKIRGRGRPALFNYDKKSPTKFERSVVAVLRRLGLTKGREVLASEGIQKVPGKKAVPVKISMPTLGKLATAHGIELHRGRPAGSGKVAA